MAFITDFEFRDASNFMFAFFLYLFIFMNRLSFVIFRSRSATPYVCIAVWRKEGGGASQSAQPASPASQPSKPTQDRPKEKEKEEKKEKTEKKEEEDTN